MKSFVFYDARIIALLFLLILLLPASDTHGEDVAIISGNMKVHEKTISGFKSTCSASTEIFTMQDNDKTLMEKIQKSKPKVIFAMGNNALEMVKDVKDIPVVFALVFNPRKIISPGSKITGVNMSLPPKVQIAELLKVLPDAKRIGVVYDPEESGHLVREARIAASERGVDIVSRKVNDQREVVKAIGKLKGNIDVLWLFPDATVITRENLRYMMTFSYENIVPLLAFSEKYVRNGAFMSFNFDAFDIGSQAGTMASLILLGVDIKKIPIAHINKAAPLVNQVLAERFGIDVPPFIVTLKNGGEDK
jgi:putative ABC transport system substrate-binding protein